MTISAPAPIKTCHIKTCMILAAGLGKRMRPMTDTVPKPLIPLCGKPLIDHVIDQAKTSHIEKFVINSHYQADKLHRHLADRPDADLFQISHESHLLETGGGIYKALPLLGSEPFLCLNSDLTWLNGATPALTRLMQAWQDEKMDALLLMTRTATTRSYHGVGDFFLTSEGIVQPRPEGEVSPYLYTGLQILHPRLFDDLPADLDPDTPFSLTRLYHQAMQKGRLHAILHDSLFFPVGTIREHQIAERILSRPFPDPVPII